MDMSFEENTHEKLAVRESVTKLHDLVHKLEEENDLPSPKKPEKGLNEHFVVHDENMNTNDGYSLENVGQLLDLNTDLDSEDSWLFESPKKLHTPGSSMGPDKWLKDDTSTPELMRVRGSLSAKLEVVAIENRKGQYQKFSDRRDSEEVRRISKHNRFGSLNSVHSLDWDYDEAKNRSTLFNVTNLSNDELSAVDSEHVTDHYQPTDGYESDPELNVNPGMPPQIASQLLNLSKDRHAWTEPIGRKTKGQTTAEQPFTLDWSDDEELQPMQIDFSKSPKSSAGSRIQVAPHPTIVKRGGSGLGGSAPQYRDNDGHNEFVAKLTGGVKARKAPNLHTSSLDDEDFNDDEIVPTKRNGNIAKPVQRRRTADNVEASGGVRIRGSGSTNHLKPKVTRTMNKSHSASELQGNSAAVRRREPTADSSPSPRRLKEPSATARTQGIPQIRRSTGTLPVKSENMARPRGSYSPSGLVKPRGQAVCRSWQQDN